MDYSPNCGVKGGHPKPPECPVYQLRTCALKVEHERERFDDGQMIARLNLRNGITHRTQKMHDDEITQLGIENLCERIIAVAIYASCEDRVSDRTLNKQATVGDVLCFVVDQNKITNAIEKMRTAIITEIEYFLDDDETLAQGENAILALHTFHKAMDKNKFDHCVYDNYARPRDPRTGAFLFEAEWAGSVAQYVSHTVSDYFYSEFSEEEMESFHGLADIYAFAEHALKRQSDFQTIFHIRPILKRASKDDEYDLSALLNNKLEDRFDLYASTLEEMESFEDVYKTIVHRMVEIVNHTKSYDLFVSLTELYDRYVLKFVDIEPSANLYVNPVRSYFSSLTVSIHGNSDWFKNTEKRLYDLRTKREEELFSDETRSSKKLIKTALKRAEHEGEDVSITKVMSLLRNN